MNYKAQAVKDVLANMKKKDKTVSNPMEATHSNPAVKTQENTPGKKVALPLKTNKGKAKAHSRKPAFNKPKGTVENPTAAEQAGRVVAIPKYYQKAKTRKS